MASFGLELVFKSALPLQRKEDCLVIYVHWKLLLNGFLCTHDQGKKSELLPENWNSISGVYQLYYTRDGQQLLLKALIVDQELFLTFVDSMSEAVFNLSLTTNNWIHTNFERYHDAFINQAGLEAKVEAHLLTPLKRVYSTKSAGCKLQHPDNLSKGSFQDSPISFLPTPFRVGGSDLDPLKRGEGGMLMDPRHTEGKPQPGIPDSLPSGAVPPGARFDPFGPIGNMPPSRSPRGGFGDPDFDHLPPPGSHDMFM